MTSTLREIVEPLFSQRKLPNLTFHDLMDHHVQMYDRADQDYSLNHTAPMIMGRHLFSGCCIN